MRVLRLVDLRDGRLAEEGVEAGLHAGLDVGADGAGHAVVRGQRLARCLVVPAGENGDLDDVALDVARVVGGEGDVVLRVPVLGGGDH